MITGTERYAVDTGTSPRMMLKRHCRAVYSRFWRPGYQSTVTVERRYSTARWLEAADRSVRRRTWHVGKTIE